MTAARERPILFSGPMVRALLAERKLQTRRVVKLEPPTDAHEVFFWSGEGLRRAGWTNVSEPGLWARRNGRDGYIRHVGHCPYGVPGDRLYVRETWKPHSLYAGMRPRDIPPTRVFYQADDRYAPSNTPWRPGIHMPRWASRLTLAITDVRVERLHDISEADAEAEGVREPSIGRLHLISPERCGEIDRASAPALFLWEMLWKSINGADSWKANPWVWAVSFEVVQ